MTCEEGVWLKCWACFGVLSVGAISGYQKAMFKYRLNKQTEQLNTFFNATARHLYSFSKNHSGQNLTQYFFKMGEIPSEMIRNINDTSIYDIFGTQMYVTYSTAFDALTITLAPKLAIKSMDNLEICKNIVIVARENSGAIYSIDSVSDWDNDDVLYLSIFGDKYCGGKKTCLRNLSLDDISELCTSHINKKDAHRKVIYRQ